ncbi:MAG: S-adenosylmethionine-dependentmethyltransferase [Herbinix sp.]|jgi:SAM-dependent methyltransferase|nr:S-adenosylmethionine-dependentmethyltransferase [Herbinix sp.]
MNQDLLNYYNNTKSPWGIMFYRMIWGQLSMVKGLKVLDFGSGFGITANHLALENEVIAIEPKEEMVNMREASNSYEQIIGGLDQLKELQSEEFDVILCHNVFEYAAERNEIVREFIRILKPNGLLSIVKHNHAGRIMQKVVYENNFVEALSLLDGGDIQVPNFGKVHYYNFNDIEPLMGGCRIEKVLGVRTFWALQQNHDLKSSNDWYDKMFEVEERVSYLEEFKNISFFHHLFLRKNKD